MQNKDNRKTLKIKSSSKDIEQFERVKLEETKVIVGNSSKLNPDQILLDDLKIQLQTATDKDVINNIKKEIKVLEKKISKKSK
ncbi:hypothetical protein [Mycoplasmoides pirum]|uniref:hypothetical protein n=1 Tax=Mycoplasmoides pirum TaxID=2122 RepID=UPI0004840C22|nr:hypothetical protein [Mycoplasmoides pirum]